MPLLVRMRDSVSVVGLVGGVRLRLAALGLHTFRLHGHFQKLRCAALDEASGAFLLLDICMQAVCQIGVVRWQSSLRVFLDSRRRDMVRYRARAMEAWCSGLTCGPVKAEIAGSNPVASAEKLYLLVGLFLCSQNASEHENRQALSSTIWLAEFYHDGACILRFRDTTSLPTLQIGS